MAIQVIDGLTYNTDTADLICNYNNDLGPCYFRNCDGDIYRTKNGRYFIDGCGGAMSIFARPCGDMTGGGSGIVPLDHDVALNMAESSDSDADPDTIERFFNVEEA